MTDNARLSALRELTLARIRMFVREPAALFWTFLFPVVMSIVLGVAFRSRPPAPIPIGVVSGPGSESVLAALAGSSDVRAHSFDAAAGQNALRIGKIAALVTPNTAAPEREGFSVRYDPVRPEGRLGRALAEDAIERGFGRKEVAPIRAQAVTEPGARYIDFLVPGLLGMGLMSSGLWGIGYAIAEMRTKKLLLRLVATPMKKSDFLISFVVVRAMMLFVEVPPLLVFARYVFGVGIAGSPVTLALLVFTGGITFALIGLLIASRTANTQIVGGLINAISLPMILGSGVFFPTDNFPAFLQPVIAALPLTALIDGVRAVMIDGAGLAAVARQLAVLGGLSAVCFFASVKLFRWR